LSQGVCRDSRTGAMDHGPIGDESCQNELLPNGTSLIARAAVLMQQTTFYLRNRGFVATLQRVATYLWACITPAPKAKKPAAAPVANYVEVLNLQPGDWVEVKSEEEIGETLDGAGRHRGLTFTPDMREYCGRTFRVFKRVRQICMETRPNEMRRLENTVILEGSVCNGGSRSCDRSCFFFWREAWLRRSTEMPSEVVTDRSVVPLRALRRSTF